MTSFKFIPVYYFIIASFTSVQAQQSNAMQINQNAPVKQSNQIQINASPEKVWAVLTNINNWTAWNNKISKAHIDQQPQVGTPFAWKVNGAVIKSTLHTVEPNTVFGWSGTTFGGSAIHNWYLESNAGGTLVKVEESMQGWLVGLFKNKMNKDLAQDMAFWLEMLKVESEKR